MTAKHVNNSIEAIMWIVYLGLMALISIVLARHMVVLNYYEPIPGSVTEESVYTDEYGEKHPSTVSLFYHHKAFSRPKPVFYDQKNEQEYGIKDAYYAEVVSSLPASEKPHLWQHLFWLWVVIAAVGLGIIMYNLTMLVGREVVFMHIKKKKNYADCCFYLNDRGQFNKHIEEVRRIMVAAHADYLRGLKLFFPKDYEADEAFKRDVTLVVEKMINFTAKTGSNKIPVDVYFTKSLVDYNTYLRRELNKLDAGEYDKYYTPKVKEELRKKWTESMNKSCHSLTSFTIDPENHRNSVCKLFDRFFENLLKEKVFDCQGVLRHDYNKALEIEEMKASGDGFKLSVVCDFQNSRGYFSFPSEISVYPGVISFIVARISVMRPDGSYSTWTVSKYSNNDKFSYSKDTDSTVDLDDFYERMINSGLHEIEI